MAIEEKEVRHVAKLAKLTFADNEILHFTEQMSDIIDMVEQLKRSRYNGCACHNSRISISKCDA